MDWRSVKKALVPLVVSGLAVLADELGVDVPGDTLEQIAAGIVNAIGVYFTRNGR